MKTIDPELIKNHIIPTELKLNYTQKKVLRKALGSNTRVTDVHHALMKVKVLDLLKIIEEQGLDANDRVVFYLASYRSEADVQRYKKFKEDLGPVAKDIKFKPTLLLSGERLKSLDKPKEPLNAIEPIYYDVCIVKPPPEDDESTN